MGHTVQDDEARRMANEKSHTVKAFDDDLSQIRAMACQTGGLAEMAIHDALEALLNHDVPAAARVAGADLQIDLLSREIESAASASLPCARQWRTTFERYSLPSR
jgi:phosphate uptake regulator